MRKHYSNGQAFSEAVKKATKGDVILFDEANDFVFNYGNKENAKLLALIEGMKRKGRF